MVRVLSCSLLVFACVFAPVDARAQGAGHIAGHLGVTFQSETAPVFGAEIAVDLLPVMQVYGTVGRMQDALPSEVQDILDFLDVPLNASLLRVTGADLNVSRAYGGVGMRF